MERVDEETLDFIPEICDPVPETPVRVIARGQRCGHGGGGAREAGRGEGVLTFRPVLWHLLERGRELSDGVCSIVQITGGDLGRVDELPAIGQRDVLQVATRLDRIQHRLRILRRIDDVGPTQHGLIQGDVLEGEDDRAETRDAVYEGDVSCHVCLDRSPRRCERDGNPVTSHINGG